MSQRTSALTVEEVNQQNNVKDTGYNFQSAQDRPATLDQYDLTNEPHRDFNNMDGQTNVYSMSATTTTAMRLAARMLKHGLRKGDVNNPVDVAETADEIQNTMSEGEARDKADILKELDDKNDDEIREIEHEIHDDKDHEKMDDKDIHDDEKHLDRLKKSRRYRKAGFLSPDNYLDADTQSQLEDFLIMPVSWAASLNYWDMIPYLTENQLQQIDDPTDLRGSIIDFVTTIDPNAIIDLQDKVLPFLDTFLAEKEAASLTASHHYRKADIYTPNFPYMTEEEERQVNNFTFYAHERANVFNYLASIPTMSEEQLNNIENLDVLHYAILRFLTRLNDPNVVNTLQNGAIVTLREYEDNSPAIKISHHSMSRKARHSMKRKARRRKASFDDLGLDPHYLDEFLKHSYEWATTLDKVSKITEDQLNALDDNEVYHLQPALDAFLNGLNDNYDIAEGIRSVLDDLYYTHENLFDDDEDDSFFASRHSMKRKARYRKASFNDLNVDHDTFDEFLKHSYEWATTLDKVSKITEDQLNALDNNEVYYLQAALDAFLNGLNDNYDIAEGIRSVLDDLYYTHENLFDDDEDDSFFASRHSHHSRRRRKARYRKASLESIAQASGVDDDDFTDYIYDAEGIGRTFKQISKLTEDQLEDLTEQDRFDLDNAITTFCDYIHEDTIRSLWDVSDMISTIDGDDDEDAPFFASRHSHHSRRHYAEADERTVCDVRMTKDGDYEARCDGKVKRFDKKGDALEWLSDHFDDSYKDKPEFTVQAARALKQIESRRTVTPSVRMASSMSPAAKTDISSILL